MKLFRFGEIGAEKPALLDADGIGRDLSAHIADLGPDQLAPDALAAIAAIDPSCLPVVPEGVRLAPCVGNVQRFFCIGLNYIDHASEIGIEPPENPIVFMKICDPTGANDPLMLPKGSTHTDWEVELGVVINQTVRHVSEEKALDMVAGYCVVNDYSERDFQNNHGGQWVKGKSCDGFGPIGPWLVTRDEVADPQNLDLWLDVNGEVQQRGTTARMIFTVPQIIAHLSRFVTLRAGDIITTGTPPGVGMGMRPQRFLKPGDEVRLGVEGLGEQCQTILPYKE
nr:fumarylacetoacetate hydrolase family protein [uncultured Cohaesibacter sp.]